MRSFHLELDDYFEGPRDIRQFSRVPLCLRLYGSVLPKIIAPLVFVVTWAAAITAVCEHVYDLGIDSILLTVLGFIVGLALSFRFSTAYERYNDGNKYWGPSLGVLLSSSSIYSFLESALSSIRNSVLPLELTYLIFMRRVQN